MKKKRSKIKLNLETQVWNNKKDTNELYSGKYKPQEIESKKYKKKKHNNSKNIKNIDTND